MGDRYDIGIDIGEGKDYSVATLFENGEYRPIALSDTISFGSDVEHSGYVGVGAGELSFSAEVVPYSQAAVDALLGWSGAYTSLLERIKIVVGKRRKTTYKTIRRDCAKRNRHK